MQRYKDFSPTPADHKGAFLTGHYSDNDRQEWLVVPVTQTRDSLAFDQSNFASALALLGGESDTLEVHRFGHWGPGWFEIILVHPSRESEVKAIEDRLENYPILDEEDLSQRESDATDEYWQNMGMNERIERLSEQGESIFAARSESASDLYQRAPKSYYRVQESARG